MSTAVDTAALGGHPPDHAPGANRSSLAPPGANYLNAKKGLASWLFTLDHKRIGIMYLVSILTFFLVAGVFAIIVRTEGMITRNTMMAPCSVNILL